MSTSSRPKALPDPIKDVLREPADEVAVQRMWNQIARREQRAPGARLPSMLRAVTVGVVVALVTYAVVSVIDRRAGESAADRVAEVEAGGSAAPGGSVAALELRWADGAPLVELEVGLASSPVARDLSDGSRVIAVPGAKLVALESSATAVSFLLQRGSVAFEVRPHGPRRWTIECGLATVEVVGTKFFLERAEDQLRVSVEEGVVLVRGERVPERVQRLTAGQTIEVSAPPRSDLLRKRISEGLSSASRAAPNAASNAASRTASNAASRAASNGASRAASNAASRAASNAASRAASNARDRAAPTSESRPAEHPREAPASSPATPAAQGLPFETTEAASDPAAPRVALESAEVLLARADAARARAEYAAAAEILETLLHRHSDDPSAALAAFTLGKIELDHLNRPARAVSAFERALSLDLPRVLREQALVQLETARREAGRLE